MKFLKILAVVLSLNLPFSISLSSSSLPSVSTQYAQAYLPIVSMFIRFAVGPTLKITMRKQIPARVVTMGYVADATIATTLMTVICPGQEVYVNNPGKIINLVSAHGDEKSHIQKELIQEYSTDYEKNLSICLRNLKTFVLTGHAFATLLFDIAYFQMEEKLSTIGIPKWANIRKPVNIRCNSFDEAEFRYIHQNDQTSTIRIRQNKNGTRMIEHSRYEGDQILEQSLERLNSFIQTAEGTMESQVLGTDIENALAFYTTFCSTIPEGVSLEEHSANLNALSEAIYESLRVIND